jgi:putative AlgH/UPF0301 family transcriptional regulator
MFRERQRYFYQAVILLLDHGAEGSYGIILNRPTQYKVRQQDCRAAGLSHPAAAGMSTGAGRSVCVRGPASAVRRSSALLHKTLRWHWPFNCMLLVAAEALPLQPAWVECQRSGVSSGITL